MAAALKTLGARPARGRRIVALTDMLELGADSKAMHAALATPIEEARVDLVFCAGPMMRALFEALPSTRRGAYAEAADGLAPRLVQAVEPGDVVMVKGSRDSRAKDLVDARWIDAPGVLASLSELAMLARADGFRAALRYDGHDLGGLLALVAAGQGLALLPANLSPP